MDEFGVALNDLLVNTFNSILRLEEEMLHRISADKLSINELHMLEAVHRQGGEGRSITDLARDLSITLPSVTAAINKLARKGYVIKSRSEQDGRVVIVQLSEEGRRAEAVHRFFHRQMVNRATQGLSQPQKDALLAGLNNLLAFFRSQEEALAQEEKP
ncbi:MAG: MarR family transcriptional regulator [Clostridiales bacterium]|nr:MarR family transcriptional regulator [Clostridiales bacterium]